MQVYIVQEGTIKPVYNLGFVCGVFKNYDDAIRYAAVSEMEARNWEENLDFYIIEQWKISVLIILEIVQRLLVIH